MTPKIFHVFVRGGSYSTTLVLLEFACDDMSYTTWISVWTNNEQSTRLMWED
jgi:hypothetical protein